MTDNLLLKVGKWSGQPENFLTEAFAHLLRNLLSNESEIGTSLLTYLTNGIVTINQSDVDKVSVETQISTPYGCPDILILTPHHRVYVEVKDEAPPGDTQISRYRQDLESRPIDIQNGIILLTRYAVVPSSKKEEPDFYIRWHQISEFLEKRRFKVANAVTRYLIDNFLGFLKEKSMAIEEVGYELPKGVHALQNLLTMIGEALASCKIPIHTKTAAWAYIGYYIDPARKHFFGVYYDDPTKLIFEGHLDPKGPHYEQLRELLSSSGVVRADGYWAPELDLASEKVHFFALGKASQMRSVENFVRESWKMFQDTEQQFA
ncbi:MAG: hypothetical protein NT123_24430 [Proteobacteria bacterium]|nr:hypothetical protein [Pseudomonadota bacterium]